MVATLGDRWRNDMIHFYLVGSILFLKELDNFKIYKLRIHLLFLRWSKFNLYQIYVTFFHQSFIFSCMHYGLKNSPPMVIDAILYYFVNLNDLISNFINLIVDFIFSQYSTYKRSINYDLFQSMEANISYYFISIHPFFFFFPILLINKTFINIGLSWLFAIWSTSKRFSPTNGVIKLI